LFFLCFVPMSPKPSLFKISPLTVCFDQKLKNNNEVTVLCSSLPSSDLATSVAWLKGHPELTWLRPKLSVDLDAFHFCDQLSYFTQGRGLLGQGLSVLGKSRQVCWLVLSRSVHPVSVNEADTERKTPRSCLLVESKKSQHTEPKRGTAVTRVGKGSIGSRVQSGSCIG
jgi:hypothetical protein